MPVLTVEKPLRDKLGDEAVDSLVRLINQSQEEHRNGILEFVEEKFERRLSEEISALRIDLKKDIADLGNQLTKDIAEGDRRLDEKISGTKSDLITHVSKTKTDLITLVSETKAELTALVSLAKADLIKWMFIFWIGQVAVILGILFTFFKN